jgi:predicted nucleic acid-binding protein
VALFLDASAVVKLYVQEPGSNFMRKVVNAREAFHGLFISELSLVEVPAAFTHKYRRGEIDRRDRARASWDFHRSERAWFNRVRLTSDILEEATHFITRSPDRRIGSGDAIQLASADRVRRVVSSAPALFLVAADRKLRSAANDLGFLAVDPEEDPFDALVSIRRGFMP